MVQREGAQDVGVGEVLLAKAHVVSRMNALQSRLADAERENAELRIEVAALSDGPTTDEWTAMLNESQEQVGKLREALAEAHDAIDDVNARGLDKRCLYCGMEGYDSNGMLHGEDCILVTIRSLTSQEVKG